MKIKVRKSIYVEYDVDELKKERKELRVQLKEEKPTKDELIEAGKMIHPYYLYDRKQIKDRIKEINSLLKQ